MLRFPRALYVALVLAFVLPLPALFAELYCDDQLIPIRLEAMSPSPSRGPLDLYTFAQGNSAQLADFIAPGPFPWWTLPDLRIAFFRPLSSALLALDHAIAGRHPLLYHLDSALWYLAAVAAAAWVLRGLFSERVAAAATLLFAACPAHWMAVSWPSARHVEVSGALAMVALGLHLRARRRSSVGLSLGAIACAALSLLAGETGLGGLCLIAAYELAGHDGPPLGRLHALAPYLAVFALYAIAYRALGFGVYGSGEYVDPIGDAPTFLTLLPLRFGVLAANATLGIPAEVAVLSPRAAPAVALAGVAALCGLAWLARRAARHVDIGQRRTLAWLALGSVLAVLPGAASIPGGRVLFLPSLALAAAIALVLLGSRKLAYERATASLCARSATGLVLLLHVAAAGPMFLAGALQLNRGSHAAKAIAEEAEIPRREGMRIFAIGLSDPLLGMYLHSSLLLSSRPAPHRVHVLTESSHDHRVRRTGERSLEIAIEGGTLLDNGFELVVRDPRFALRAGDEVALDAVTIRILEDDAGRPTRFEVMFDRPLEDPSLAFVHWKGGKLRALETLAIGEERRLVHERGPTGF